jgi:uncharacterized protein
MVPVPPLEPPDERAGQPNVKIVIAGGSGALGRRIVADLTERGHDVAVLTRSPRPGTPVRQIGWDGETVGAWAAELAGAALINLAGALVDRPPTVANIELLTRSRVAATRARVQAAARLDPPPVAWIQMSTLAIYSDAGDAVLDERAPVPTGLPQMTGVARAWERAAADATAARLVTLRTAVVLDPMAPAMRRLAGLVRYGLGGRIGSGKQWVSWLHYEDFQAIIRFCLSDPAATGIVHATSPNPVTNADLMAGLRTALHRPSAPPTPAWLLRAGAAVLRSDPALALTGRRCVPRVLLDAGFTFGHPDIGPALQDLLGSKAA